MRRFIALLLVVLAVLGLSTLSSMAQAQTFEVGYEVALESSTPHLPKASSGFFLYATHDFFIAELEAVDTQFYLSPSVELIFGSRYWLELQFLMDSPLFTVSARTKYESSGRLESRLGLLITPFD